MLTRLSHSLTLTTPSYAGGETLRIIPQKLISKGGSSNNYSISMPCHLGTHIDAPKHFDDSGRPIASYPVNDLVFNKPSLLDIEKESGELILPEDLHEFEESISASDMLLLRTGFQKYREADPRRYATENPGVSEKAAKYLAGFHGLRALGFDFISLSSVPHREEGGEAHRALLAGRNFFIVEDMNLINYHPHTGRIIVVPLFIEGVDSAPCTVLAEY